MRLALTLALVLLHAATAAAERPAADAPAIVAEVRRATARYLDIANARADGYVQASGMEARHGYHWVHPGAQARALATGTLDLASPPVLLYVERQGVWQLAGVEYALPAAPAAGPLPASAWHRHEASCHYRDFREIAAASTRECPDRHPASNEIFVGWHPTLATAHVWAWYPNPDGPFAETNAYLAPYGGFVTSHDHARNPAEMVYSQYTHRIAGGILLVLAALTVWESWRPRPFPWNAISAPFWGAFGAYLIPSSDPESWPYGPQRFAQIFDDPLVLQHKLLALVPIGIGVIGVLRGLGRLPSRRLTQVLAGLALAGGATLFFHFHDGRFHFDAIYVQHALMGGTALGVGIALLVGTRTAIPRRWLTWAWPGFLAVMAAVLLLYRET
jgi:hypothetical protein